MYETFNSQSKNIGELLGGNERARIVVPKFQRGYSWEKKHVEAFWTDITTFQREGQVKGGPDKYFLGPIVLQQESKDVIHLLDGQQRLATATILFTAIRDAARELKIQAATDFARDVQREMIEKSASSGYSLVMGEMDQLYFAETIQMDPPANKKAALRSHRNIQKTKTVLGEAVRKSISGLDPATALASLKELYQAVRSDLVMACIPVASERDAFRIFETLNDRGLRLSVPDLLLNYLMRVAADDNERRQIRNFWNEMLEQLGRRDINRFLRHMWVSKYGDLKSKDLFTALKEEIESKHVQSLEFTRTCADECESYVRLLDLDEEHLGKATPFVRVLARQLDVQPSLPMMLSSYRLLDANEFEKVVRWMVVFVVRYSVVSRLDSGGLETVFFALAQEIRARMSDPKHAKSVLAHIKETLTKNAPSDDQVKAAVAELILENDEAKYLLSRLATRMQTNTKEVKVDEANLEHVFPKNPAKEWKEQEAMEPLLWHIGNLTMLGERLNRDAANKEFAVKAPHYSKNSELEMAQDIARTYKEWNKDTISDRARRLAPLVIEVWDFDNPSRV
ncbi:MAG: DUF262 domain-containing HNH endonuclease family protein [Bryobacteraceae bacterium]